MSDVVNGRCECGQVSFSVESPRSTVTVCHCSQCRRMSGHLWASTHAAFENLKFDTDEGLLESEFPQGVWTNRPI